MNRDYHHRLVRAGLLDGPVDHASIAAWPAWAREHLRTCGSCQEQLEAERHARQAYDVLAVLDARVAGTGPPSLAALHARLERRTLLEPAALVRGSERLPTMRLRAEQSPLELVRTDRGLRAWHPHARELLVLAARNDRRPFVLRHQRERTPGVGLDIAFSPGEDAKVLGVASLVPLEEELWLTWMRDALDAGRIASLVRENESDAVHVSVVEVNAPLRASMLRLRSRPLPDATPKVAALLKRAAQAGRDDDAVEAARLYGRALELAFTANDDTGQVKAAAGVAYALDGLGYAEDGERVLRWVIERHALDKQWGGWVCRHMGNIASNALDVDGAERWLQEAINLGDTEAVWIRMLTQRIAGDRGQHARVLELARDLADSELPPHSLLGAQLRGAGALAELGRGDEASAWLDQLDTDAELPLELRLWMAQVDEQLARGSGGAVDWPAILEKVRSAIAVKDGSVLASWDVPPLLMLAEAARRARQHEVAHELFSLRFLDSSRASDPAVHLLGVAQGHDGLLVASPNGGRRLRRLSMTRSQFRNLVHRARDELRGQGELDACRTLGAMLFADGFVSDEPVLVGSDGLLTEAPLLAVALAAAGERRPVPVLRELVGLRQASPARLAAPLASIASMADATGDLPWAAREVESTEAALWLRGKQVRRASLQLEEPVGLLHIGLHARREHGVPQLLFADGPLGPAEIAAHVLPGAPVVLLAGCATGVVAASVGIERSLADAFLRAGASAVVATRWPVEDREILAFVRAVVQAWPFRDVPARVAQICDTLRRQGHPARCWAAPVVY